jgi:cytidylate kinase
MTTLSKVDEMIVIGLSGTNGAGKDTVGHLLANRHELLFVSVSDLLREEARRRNLDVTRENLRTISAEWRREFGLGVLVDKAIEHCQSFGDKYVGVIACPMRNTGETKHLQSLGGKVLWIDADPHVRYRRVQEGAARRGRSGEDNKTYEQFLAEQQDEMVPPPDGDEASLNMAGVRDMSDAIINNDAGNLEELLAKSEQALGLGN